MRIISGKFKGRSIAVPKNFKGRPTTDFARESLFNILNSLVDLEEANILDLFSGTGAFSLECVSRDAKSVTAVELSSVHVKFIHQNFEFFEADQAGVIRADVFKFIASAPEKYDLIFADPPFDLPMLAKLPELIFKHELLNEGGWFILEHGDRVKVNHLPGFDREKKYGSVHFSFFRHLPS